MNKLYYFLFTYCCICCCCCRWCALSVCIVQQTIATKKSVVYVIAKQSNSKRKQRNLQLCDGSETVFSAKRSWGRNNSTITQKNKEKIIQEKILIKNTFS